MIETAYAALAEAIGQVLGQSGFLDPPDVLRVDPPETFSPSGDELSLVTVAALVKVQTRPVRTLLGGQAPRYVVERECRLELAAVGPRADLRAARLAAALDGLSRIAVEGPTLDGQAERLVLTERTDDELPPNGESVFITFILRVRSGDALGLSS